MPLINRDQDTGEQRIEVTESLSPVATGVTSIIYVAPYACEVSTVRMAALGISGTPTSLLSIQRFIVGTGITNITGGFTTLTLQAYGTSGLQTVAQNASGNTLIQLAAGDLLQAVSGGANSSVADVDVCVTIKCLQDIRNHFGV